MADNFAYDGSKIVVCNSSIGFPMDFAQMYEADLEGSLELLAAETCTTGHVLGTQIQPAEELALQISFVIDVSTAGAGDTLDITGTDFKGIPQVESIDVSGGDDTYTGAKFWQTITNIDCTGWADGTLQVLQSRWGVIHATRGPQLLDNDHFIDWDNPTVPDNWTKVGTHDGVNNYVEEVPADTLHFVSDGTIVGISYADVTVVGNQYLAVVDVGTSSGEQGIKLFGADTYGAGFIDTDTSFIFTADSVNLIIYRAYPNNTTDITINSLKLYELIPQYKIDCDIDFGDTSTETHFQSMNEEIYFSDGKVFTITSNAYLELGDLDNDYGISGSYWSVAPSANLAITASGTTGTFYLYDSTLRSRNKDLWFQDGTIAINKGKLIFDVSSEKPIFFETINSLSIKEFYVVGCTGLYLYKTPTDFENVHVHNTSYGIFTPFTIIADTALVTNASLCEVYQSGAFPFTLKDPKFHPSTVIIGNASGSIIEQYTCNIHTTDKDGADLADVTVDCEYAHLVEGSDSKTYKCIQDHTSVDATHKPITGSEWEDFWELYDASGGLGGPWQTTFDFKAGTQEFAQQTTDADGDISEQVIQYKKWLGISELLEARIHKFTFAHASYPDMTIEDVIVSVPLVWRIDMGQSTSDLTTIVDDAITANTDIDAIAIDVAGLDGATVSDIADAVKALTGITEGGTWTLEKVLKIMSAWIAGNWRVKATDSDVQELLDAENGTTVILEQSLTRSPTAGSDYRTITVKI